MLPEFSRTPGAALPLLFLLVACGGPEPEDTSSTDTDTGENFEPCDVLQCDHGTCLDTEAGGAECLCDLGWGGLLCDTLLDACDDDPCQNGGTCTDGGDGISYTCACAEGWEGDACERSVDDCPALDPCVNGVCTDLHMDWECACEPDWAGEYCDEVEDSCADVPCGFASLCTDGFDTYTCDDYPLVDLEAASNGDGLSWETAYDNLADALAWGTDVVWVKSTTLTATDTSPVLTLPEGVTLVGGFDRALTGRDGDPAARDPADYTLLDGNGTATHVVVATAGSGLDGFRITGGAASGATEAEQRGAGVLVDTVDDVTLRNVVVEANTASGWGGGLACIDSAGLTIEDSAINGNFIDDADTEVPAARGAGGSFSGCSGTLANSEIRLNRAQGGGLNGPAHGGGLWIDGGDLVLTDVTVASNRAVGHDNDAIGVEVWPADGGNAQGGGIWLANATVSWTGLVLDANLAQGGDGVEVYCDSTRYDTYDSCMYRNGSGGHGRGAGLYADATATLTLFGGRAVDNGASGGVGATGGSCLQYSGGPPLPSVWTSCLPGNQGTATGGAFYQGGSITLPVYDPNDASGNNPDFIRPCPSGYTGEFCEIPP